MRQPQANAIAHERPVPASANRPTQQRRARQAVRQDCSFAKKQESPPALLVVVLSRALLGPGCAPPLSPGAAVARPCPRICSRRELEMVKLTAEGYTGEEIGEQLVIRKETVCQGRLKTGPPSPVENWSA